MGLETWTMPGPTLAYMAGIERAGAPNPTTNPEGIVVEGVITNQFAGTVVGGMFSIGYVVFLSSNLLGGYTKFGWGPVKSCHLPCTIRYDGTPSQARWGGQPDPPAANLRVVVAASVHQHDWHSGKHFQQLRHAS